MLNPVDHLRKLLSEKLKVAMVGRDQVAVSVLRGIMSALDNASAVSLEAAQASQKSEVPRRELSHNEIVEILKNEIQVRQVARKEFERIGNAIEAEAIRKSIDIIQKLVDELSND